MPIWYEVRTDNVPYVDKRDSFNTPEAATSYGGMIAAQYPGSVTTVTRVERTCEKTFSPPPCKLATTWQVWWAGEKVAEYRSLDDAKDRVNHIRSRNLNAHVKIYQVATEPVKE
jgi:hypothetical protein